MHHHNATTTAGNPGLSPSDRERLTLAYHAARVRCGLTDRIEPSGPITFAGRFAALLRRLVIGGAA